MVVRKAFDAATLTRFRAMSADDALDLLSMVLKDDRMFVPVKDVQTRRWHVTTVRGEFEILTTGIQWYDTRAQRGGGGAIDLAMHILGLSFVDAVKHLIAKGGVHGAHRS